MINAGGFFYEKNVGVSGSAGETQVILTGKRRAIVENYRNLQRYTREEIIILTPSGRLVIHGKRLEISCYTAFEMCVCGRIESILLEEGKKK